MESEQGRAVNRLVYHYYASAQSRPGERVELDGILLRTKPVQTFDDYTALKKAIAEFDSVEVSRLTVKSLTFLGYETTTDHPAEVRNAND